ncbi:MAG: hypothetical protein ACE5GU_10110 [Candidatus Scalinduaceae bacterium]
MEKRKKNCITRKKKIEKVKYIFKNLAILSWDRLVALVIFFLWIDNFTSGGGFCIDEPE